MVMASRSSIGGGSGSGGGSGRTRVGRYELGRTLGEGTFAKVKFARNLETGDNVAIKILNKEKVLKHKMIGQVINNKGYDGAKADLWSCGVILFVLMAGYLPFEESNLVALYKKIFKADFTCPSWFSSSAKKLIKRILDPDPSTRITINEVLTNDWFKKGFKPPVFEQEEVTLDDVNAISTILMLLLMLPVLVLIITFFFYFLPI